MSNTKKGGVSLEKSPSLHDFTSGISLVAIGFLMLNLKDIKINFSAYLAYMHLHKGNIYI